MKSRWFLVLACLLITACEKPKETVETPAVAESPAVVSVATVSPAEKFKTTKKEFDDAFQTFVKAYQAAPAKERAAVMKELRPSGDDYAATFMTIAEENPGEKVAADSLMWITQNTRGTEAYDKALDLLFTDHIEEEGLKSLCTGLSRGEPSQKVEDHLNALLEKSPHDSVKAAATFGLANYLKGLPAYKTRIKDNPSSKVSDEVKSYLMARADEPMVIESLYQSLGDQYGDMKPSPSRPRTYKEAAEGALFELNNLAIGKEVPEIEGSDLDGKDFKLSEYRGKVVFLDFWGDW